MAHTKSPTARDTSANLGFEAKLWKSEDCWSVAETAAGNRSNPATRRLAIMNLALRGIDADTFRRDLHPDLCANKTLTS